MRLDEKPFTCQCEKKNKKAEVFQISHYYWSFSSDIMAVKGLNKNKNAEVFQISHYYWSFSSDIMAVKGLNKN